MKKLLYVLPMLVLMAMPHAVSAHEHATFEIGGTTYNFVVGSLNEPITVDDKTGLDFAVTKGVGHPTMGPDGDMDGPMTGTTPVTGLEDTLKVELVAGSAKKNIELRPAWGSEGAYEAFFYPTRATTFSYHFTGTIEGHPVDLTFTCLPEGQEAKDDTTRKELPGGIVQLSRAGYFGCPVPKESLGFPDEGVALTEVAADAASTTTRANVALALGALGLALGAFALRRKQ